MNVIKDYTPAALRCMNITPTCPSVKEVEGDNLRIVGKNVGTAEDIATDEAGILISKSYFTELFQAWKVEEEAKGQEEAKDRAAA